MSGRRVLRTLLRIDAPAPRFVQTPVHPQRSVKPDHSPFCFKIPPQLVAQLSARVAGTGTSTDVAVLLQPVCQVLEYVLAEALELAARCCMQHERRVLTPTDLHLAIGNDPELNGMLMPALLASFRAGFARADVDTTVGSFHLGVEDEDVDYAAGGRWQRERAWWTDAAKWDYCLSAWMRGLAGDYIMVRTVTVCGGSRACLRRCR